MRYLVTGGAGFIGSHLIELLHENGHDTVCMDDLSTGYRSNIAHVDGVDLIESAVQEVMDPPEVDGIYHLAAQASVPLSISEFYESSANNLLGTLKVFEWARQHSIPVVYASSSAIYGNLPVGDEDLEQYEILSPYAQDKLTMEHYAHLCWKLYQIPSIGHRFFNVYGPRQDPSSPYSGVISIFVDRMAKKLPITVNGGYQTRDFVYVKDVAMALHLSMQKLHSTPMSETLNIGTGISITVDDLVSDLREIMDHDPEVRKAPLPFGDPEQSGGTYGKMDSLLGMDLSTLTRFKEGLRTTVEFCIKDLS